MLPVGEGDQQLLQNMVSTYHINDFESLLNKNVFLIIDFIEAHWNVNNCK